MQKIIKGILQLIILLPVFTQGQVTKEIIIHSKELNADRKIWINTPAFYDLGKDSLHLLFLLDGNNRSLFEYTVAAKRFIEGNSVDLSDFKAPESVIVGIEQAEDRWEDFGDSIHSAQFLSFMENELLPYVTSHYRTVNYKILAGHSLGARFAINTLLNKPGLFNAVIAASPAFSQKATKQVLAKFDAFFNTPLQYDKALYFSTTYSKGDGTEEGFREFFESLQKYLELKNVKNFRFQSGSSRTLGHAKSPYFSIPEGLHFIYSPLLWQLPPDSLFSNRSGAAISVKNYQQQIQKHFGVGISIHPYVPVLVDELLKSNKTKQAIALLKEEVNNQPADISLYAQLLALLKKNNAADYQSYRARLTEIFSLVKTPVKEQNEWLEWIEKNSR